MGGFGGEQGFHLLNDFSLSFLSLIAKLCGTDQDLTTGLDGWGPQQIVMHFERFKGWSALSLKELFSYMELVLPKAFDSNVFVPFGIGAQGGCKLVLSIPSNWQLQAQLNCNTRSLVARVPDEMRIQIWRATQEAAQQLPTDVASLPGYRMEFADPQNVVSVLDAEVCFCWFQAFLKNPTRAPGK